MRKAKFLVQVKKYDGMGARNPYRRRRMRMTAFKTVSKHSSLKEAKDDYFKKRKRPGLHMFRVTYKGEVVVDPLGRNYPIEEGK